MTASISFLIPSGNEVISIYDTIKKASPHFNNKLYDNVAFSLMKEAKIPTADRDYKTLENRMEKTYSFIGQHRDLYIKSQVNGKTWYEMWLTYNGYKDAIDKEKYISKQKKAIKRGLGGIRAGVISQVNVSDIVIEGYFNGAFSALEDLEKEFGQFIK